MKTVFELVGIMPVEHQELDVPGLYDTDENFCINVDRHQIGIYDSVELAEDMMISLIERTKKSNDKYGGWTNYFGFILTEKSLNPELDKYDNYPDFESVRTYLSDGTINCFSDYDDSCKKKFSGRDVSQKVKSGEYCYWLAGDKLMPTYLEKASMTKDEWKEFFNEKDVVGDFTDDSGLVYTTLPGHDHPFSPYIFPESNLAFAKISDKAKDKITEMIKIEEEENKQWLQSQETNT